MLKISNLNIVTHKGRVLVEGFNFILNDGDKIALIGEEGNGKSTILKIIAGIDVSDYVSHSGDITSDGTIGYLSQKIDDKYLNKSLMEYISDDAFELDYYNYYEALKAVNIDTKIIKDDCIIRTLSGGEKVKVSLARLLYKNPDILLFDEPTNDLDLKTLIWLEEFIKNDDRAIIFISHDETLLEECSNGVLHLEQLKRKQETRLTYSGEGYRQYEESRNRFIKRNNEIAAKEKSEFNKQLERYRQIYQKVEHQQSTVSRQDPFTAAKLKNKMHAIKSFGKKLDERKDNLTKKFEPEEAINIFFEDVDINPNKTIIDYHLDELVVDKRVLSKNIDLYVSGKDKVCIIGDNGVGKTTLIKKIYELLSERKDIKLGYMPQNYYEVMDYEKNVIDFLMENKQAKERSKIQTYLGSLKFTTEEMSHQIKGLSEGQKCKLLIVKMILDRCDVLLLDEPTRNLSPLSNPKVREILNNYRGSIVSISHDRKYINEVSNKIYVLNSEGLIKMD